MGERGGVWVSRFGGGGCGVERAICGGAAGMRHAPMQPSRRSGTLSPSRQPTRHRQQAPAPSRGRDGATPAPLRPHHLHPHLDGRDSASACATRLCSSRLLETMNWARSPTTLELGVTCGERHRAGQGRAGRVGTVVGCLLRARRRAAHQCATCCPRRQPSIPARRPLRTTHRPLLWNSPLISL